ncbi:protein FAM216A [Paralichthys olivaceus]|uniref:protein FAM216A n=1 Tax=Paralichthys olivaceus TaxID=8255 RepID=UPI003753194D
MNQSKMGLKDVGLIPNSGLKTNRSAAAAAETQTHQITTIRIPETMTAAPFLKHSALTPAQREYLYTVSASCSSAHVRGLITRHYMNVLHRCKRAGFNSDSHDLIVTSVTSPESEGEKRQTTKQSDVSSRARHKAKISTSARHPGKSFLPKIPQSRGARSQDQAVAGGRG